MLCICAYIICNNNPLIKISHLVAKYTKGLFEAIMKIGAYK